MRNSLCECAPHAGSSALYKTLAGICLFANLWQCIESLPLPTTTENPHILPDSTSDATNYDVTTETSESNDSTVSDDQTAPSIASHVYAILTIFHQPTSPPDSGRRTAQDPNPISSAMVSSSTGSLSEDNCSSEAVELGPCRKRTASFDGLAGAVFSYLTDHVRRSLTEANPAGLSGTWRFPNLEEVAHPADEISSDSLGSGESIVHSSADMDDVAPDSGKQETSTLPTTKM